MPATPRIGIWNAWIFMSVFILQMGVMFLLNKEASNRSHAIIKAKRTKLERVIAYIANFIWLMAMIYSIFLPIKVEGSWFIIGLFIFIIGLLLLAAATYNFVTTPSEQLITNGIYKFSRHPMYLATFFICLGSGISALSWLFIAMSIIIAICFYQEAIIEERYCLDRYADAYKEYMAKTPRLFGVPKE